MPIDSTAFQGVASWLRDNWLQLLVWTIVALVAYRLARPLVHRAVVRAVRTTVEADVDPSVAAEETAKRVETLESLLARVIRGAVVMSLAFVFLAAFDLLPVVAGLGLVAAAITLAGQSIVLDYLMGILILAEGQYFRGDWVGVGTVEGTVEDVGLRRTVLRDATGTVHSISNGEIRISSNFTRVFAGLVIEIPVVPGTDVDRAGAVIEAVGVAMQADPLWHDRILLPPTFRGVSAVTDTGLTLRAVGRVRPGDRFTAPGEYRKRLLMAFAEAGIETPQRGRLVMAPESMGQAPPAIPPGEASTATPQTVGPDSVRAGAVAAPTEGPGPVAEDVPPAGDVPPAEGPPAEGPPA